MGGAYLKLKRSIDNTTNPDNNLAVMNFDSEQTPREDNVHRNSTATESNNEENEIHIERFLKKEPETLDAIIVDRVTNTNYLAIEDTNRIQTNNTVFMKSTTFHDNISPVKTESGIGENITVDADITPDNAQCISMIDGNTRPHTFLGLEPLCVKTSARKRTQKRLHDFDYTDMFADDTSDDVQRIRERVHKPVKLLSSKSGNQYSSSKYNDNGRNHLLINDQLNLAPKKKRDGPSKTQQVEVITDKAENRLSDQNVSHDSKIERNFQDKLQKLKSVSCKKSDKTCNESTISDLSGSTSGVMPAKKTGHSNTILLKCSFCNYSSNKVKLFRAHQRRVHLDDELKKFQCKYCYKLFGIRTDLKTHEHRVHERDLFSCSHCENTYKTTYAFRLHIATHKDGYIPIRPHCSECNKSFGNVATRNNHIRWIHRGEKPHFKPYLCNICGKMFTNIVTFKEHQRIHTGERPYVCIVCGHTFQSKTALEVHACIHEDIRNFKCNGCHKTFKQKASLTIHRRIHAKTNNHKCLSCGKTFTQAGSLHRHIRIHTKAQLFQCNQCSAAFTDKSIARRHAILVHKFKSNWQTCILLNTGS